MITILKQPQFFTPAYNDMTYTVNSNNKAACSFRYIFDVYINLVFITRLERFPFGADGYATVDISTIAQDYVSYNLHENLVGFEKNAECIKYIHVQCGEAYDNSLTCSDGITIYPNLLMSDLILFWNAALQKDEFINYDADTYLNYLTGQTKWLSNMPDNTRIGIDDKFVMNFLQFSNVTPDFVKIVTYDYSMNVIDTYNIDNTLGGFFVDVSQYLVSFGCGPSQLNSTPLSLGVQPVIADDVYFYSIQLMKDESPGESELSDIKLFEVDKRCSKYTAKRLMWLNRLGGFDSYTFSMENETNINIARNEFTKKYSNLSLSERGITTISVDASESYIYNSDWMTEQEDLWIKELYTSIEVYLYSNKPDSNFEFDAIICANYNTIYEIQGGAYDGGHADFLIDDGGITIPTSTTFNYTLVDGSSLCISNSGTGTITGYLGGGVYHTDIVACDPGFAPLLSGTLIKTPLLPTSVGFSLISGSVNIGDYVYYEITSGGACITVGASGYGIVTDFTAGIAYVEIYCDGDLGCSATGTLTVVNYAASLDPLIVTSSVSAIKETSTVKNITSLIELKASSKINLQKN